MGIADEIDRLNELRRSGAITEQEYEQAKQKLFAQQSTSDPFSQAVDNFTTNISSNVNTWSMLLHLSQFCGYFVPLAGLIVPIVMWQIKKDESKLIDRHGRVVVNWMITVLILVVVFGLLAIFIIGVPLLILLGIAAVVFPIIGAIKANNGEVWPYPLSIRFFPID